MPFTIPQALCEKSVVSHHPQHGVISWNISYSAEGIAHCGLSLHSPDD